MAMQRPVERRVSAARVAAVATPQTVKAKRRRTLSFRGGSCGWGALDWGEGQSLGGCLELAVAGNSVSFGRHVDAIFWP